MTLWGVCDIIVPIVPRSETSARQQGENFDSLSSLKAVTEAAYRIALI